MRALAAALVGAVGLSVATSTAAAQPRLQGIGTFVRPVHVAAAPADYERLYVVEQRGTIQVMRNGQTQPFLDLRDVVLSPEDAGGGNEEGLLSIAFPQDFQQSRRFYVYFTDSAGNNRVEEVVAPSADAADPASRRLVIALEHPGQSNHNGGQLQFGPDGMLYLAPGDGGGGNDPANNAENLLSPLGKVLRIDPRASGAQPYTIPPDNPFVGQPGARGEIWSYGLRNPFRFSFDRVTGDLVIGDVGQGTTEEIDFAPASQGRGRGLDFGWDDCEGSFVAGSATARCPRAGATAPVIDAFASNGWHAIIAGYVLRDPSVPSLLGRFVYSDTAKGELWSARLAAPSAQDVGSTGIGVPGATSFGEDAAGCVYVAQLGGGVSRIVENDTRIPCQPAAGGGGPAGGGGGSPGGGAGGEVTGGGGGGSTRGAGGPTVSTLDTIGPRLTARVKRRQRVLRQGGVVAYARCDEPCSVAAGGWVRVGTRVHRLRRGVRSTPAGRTLRIKARLTAEGRRALRGALFRGRPAKLRMGLRARDASGNPSALLRHTVRVGR